MFLNSFAIHSIEIGIEYIIVVSEKVTFYKNRDTNVNAVLFKQNIIMITKDLYITLFTFGNNFRRIWLLMQNSVFFLFTCAKKREIIRILSQHKQRIKIPRGQGGFAPHPKKTLRCISKLLSFCKIWLLSH